MDMILFSDKTCKSGGAQISIKETFEPCEGKERQHNIYYNTAFRNLTTLLSTYFVGAWVKKNEYFSVSFPFSIVFSSDAVLCHLMHLSNS